MVAFPTVTSKREDELRALIVEWRGLLTEILRHSAQNGIPIGPEWPELLAAIKKATLKYPQAVLEVMRRRAAPMNADEVFADLARSQLLREKPEMGMVASTLSRLADDDKIEEVPKVGPGTKRWVIRTTQTPPAASEPVNRLRAK